jgi:hypothetical protein
MSGSGYHGDERAVFGNNVRLLVRSILGVSALASFDCYSIRLAGQVEMQILYFVALCEIYIL